MTSRLRLMPYLLATAITTLSSIVVANNADAQDFAVAPVNVQLASGQAAATLTVENRSDRPTSFQIRVFEWSEKDGQDQLVPTTAMVASPPLGTIESGGTQLIRLVLRLRPAAKEATYRIWLDQIPSVEETGAVRMALRLSIPVFAEPDGRAGPDVHWRIVRKDGEVYLIGDNVGTKHETIRDLVLKAADGSVLKTDGNVSAHILAGGERSWHITATRRMPPPGSTVRLTVDTDGPSVDQPIAFPDGR